MKTMISNSTQVEENVKIDTKPLIDLMLSMGISMSGETVHKLVIWNDDHNDMLYVVVCLSEVCGISQEDCVTVMLEAHEKGKAIAKTGSFEILKDMKKNLNDRGIEATIEK